MRVSGEFLMKGDVSAVPIEEKREGGVDDPDENWWV